MTTAERIPIVVIGSGFGGIAMAIALRRAGERDFVMLERATDVGGVWRDNTYPGAACDVVSRMYSFSYDQDYEWSTAFAPQPEIFSYIRKVVDRHDLRAHIRFNTEVASARFDERRGTVAVETATGDVIENSGLDFRGRAVQPRQNPRFPRPRRLQGRAVPFRAWRHDFDSAGQDRRRVRKRRQRGPIRAQGRGAGRNSSISTSARPNTCCPAAIFPGTGEWDAWLQRRRWLRGLARLKIFFACSRNSSGAANGGQARGCAARPAYRAMLAGEGQGPGVEARN